ncbi:hypothetical protein [Cellulomonas wangsupingiae]|uniref:hypothetical protein n=1 Tax=Cellulomonas wangsupingiae TaxID=2968085 RepID=UPI001D0F128A|nr:hypothetical protein [Cellulomonas wangsupingiae]MCM0639865.1 hypothetical protein [Cellulomonas wangsupingiae]
MPGDLDDLFARAANDIEAATAPAPAATLSHVHARARRGRIRRHAAESVGAVAVVAVVAVGLTFAGRPPVEPAHPTPVPTGSATPSPSATPTPAPPVPTGPPVREDDVDDATALARLSAPRTGEVWSTPARVAAPVPVSGDTPLDWYEVGTRGDARVYAVTRGTDARDDLDVWLDDPRVTLYELQDATLRHIACPSARPSDACGPDGVEGVDAQRDEDTFYDSLTPPRRIALPDGYVVRTGQTWATDRAVTGSMSAAYWDNEVQVHADLGGGLRVVEEIRRTHTEGPFAGWREVAVALQLPYGALVRLEAQDLPGGDSGGITWDDGVTRASDDPRSWPPSGSRCDGPGFAVPPGGTDRSAWVRAGEADGVAIHVPAPGSTDLATQVFGYQQERSYAMDEDGFTDGADAYPLTSVQELLDRRALLGFEGPGGRWMLALRGDAVNTAYECV